MPERLDLCLKRSEWRMQLCTACGVDAALRDAAGSRGHRTRSRFPTTPSGARAHLAGEDFMANGFRDCRGRSEQKAHPMRALAPARAAGADAGSQTSVPDMAAGADSGHQARETGESDQFAMLRKIGLSEAGTALQGHAMRSHQLFIEFSAEQ